METPPGSMPATKTAVWHDQVSGGFVLTAAGVIGAGMVAAGVCCVSGYAMAKDMKRV